MIEPEFGFVVAVEGTATETRVRTTADAQLVAERYDRPVRLFCRWTGKYVGALVPQRGRARGQEEIK